ncbi:MULTISPECIES: hypothetical protein [Salinibaculum]|uniref:hypothetical protein n=1 Tax=Salinibaculum TaxID=2732368 RepID=UPI0030CCE9E5
MYSSSTNDEPETLLNRRRLLTALGGLSAVALAGCGGITNQSFEAAPVGLSSEGVESLQLGEVTSDSLTLSESAAGGNVSVSITTHTAVYSRALALGGQ